MSFFREKILRRGTVVGVLTFISLILYLFILLGCINKGAGIDNLYWVSISQKTAPLGTPNSNEVRIGYFGICTTVAGTDGLTCFPRDTPPNTSFFLILSPLLLASISLQKQGLYPLPAVASTLFLLSILYYVCVKDRGGRSRKAAKTLLGISAAIGLASALACMASAKALEGADELLRGSMEIKSGKWVVVLLWIAASLHVLVVVYIACGMPGLMGGGYGGSYGGSGGGGGPYEEPAGMYTGPADGYAPQASGPPGGGQPMAEGPDMRGGYGNPHMVAADPHTGGGGAPIEGTDPYIAAGDPYTGGDPYMGAGDPYMGRGSAMPQVGVPTGGARLRRAAAPWKRHPKKVVSPPYMSGGMGPPMGGTDSYTGGIAPSGGGDPYMGRQEPYMGGGPSTRRAGPPTGEGMNPYMGGEGAPYMEDGDTVHTGGHDSYSGEGGDQFHGVHDPYMGGGGDQYTGRHRPNVPTKGANFLPRQRNASKWFKKPKTPAAVKTRAGPNPLEAAIPPQAAKPPKTSKPWRRAVPFNKAKPLKASKSTAATARKPLKVALELKPAKPVKASKALNADVKALAPSNANTKAVKPTNSKATKALGTKTLKPLKAEKRRTGAKPFKANVPAIRTNPLKAAKDAKRPKVPTVENGLIGKEPPSWGLGPDVTFGSKTAKPSTTGKKVGGQELPSWGLGPATAPTTLGSKARELTAYELDAKGKKMPLWSKPPEEKVTPLMVEPPRAIKPKKETFRKPIKTVRPVTAKRATRTVQPRKAPKPIKAVKFPKRKTRGHTGKENPGWGLGPLLASKK